MSLSEDYHKMAQKSIIIKLTIAFIPQINDIIGLLLCSLIPQKFLHHRPNNNSLITISNKTGMSISIKILKKSIFLDFSSLFIQNLIKSDT